MEKKSKHWQINFHHSASLRSKDGLLSPKSLLIITFFIKGSFEHLGFFLKRNKKMNFVISVLMLFPEFSLSFLKTPNQFGNAFSTYGF